MIAIFDITNGGIQYSDLLKLSFDEFDSLLDYCIDIQKKIKGGMNGTSRD